MDWLLKFLGQPSKSEAQARADGSEAADGGTSSIDSGTLVADHGLTAIRDLRIVPGQGGPDGEGMGEAELQIVYESQVLRVAVTPEMARLDIHEFIGRVADQVFEHYDLLFDTDDLFQLVQLLKGPRTPDEAPDFAGP